MDLTRGFLTCKMVGRLGNQMFMMANCIAQSLQYNKPFLFSKDQVFDLNHYKDNVYRKLDFKLNMLPQGRIISTPYQYEVVKPYDEGVTIYEGYYQSEKNFINISSFIKFLFSPTEEFVEQTYKEHPELLNEVVTCINVRRGDYLLNLHTHPVITSEYVNEAANQIKNTDIYFIIGDDLDWCRENIKLPKMKFIDVSTWKALWTISLCHNFILSNSSFSWWGAYLCTEDSKMVVAPSTWCGPGGPQDTKDVICESWMEMPTKYKEGQIFPI